jgi:phosphoribosylaminoimidazolecarboxamide formyltransferase/IMP cyclohydrolase
LDSVLIDDWEAVSERTPSPEELHDLQFAWRVAAHTKSNAIVIARNGQAVGIGAGDQSRVGASARAVRQAGDRAIGGVAASDAFFPFADGIEMLAEAGVTAVVEPGGSKGDSEVVAAANEGEIALVFTGRRHFKH